MSPLQQVKRCITNYSFYAGTYATDFITIAVSDFDAIASASCKWVLNVCELVVGRAQSTFYVNRSFCQICQNCIRAKINYSRLRKLPLTGVEPFLCLQSHALLTVIIPIA